MSKKTKSTSVDSVVSTPPARPLPAKVSLTKHIRLGCIGRSATGELFVELRYAHKGKRRTRLLPFAGLSQKSAVFDALNQDGAWLISPQARQELIRRIQGHRDDRAKVKVATRLGWHDGVFVLPGWKVGPGRKKLRVYLEPGRPERFSRYRVGGSLKGWQKIAKLAEGNSRLCLLIAADFSGPVAALLGLEQIGLMLVGHAEAGKTSAVVAAGSVWGRHIDPTMGNNLGFGQPFNATDNDLEDELLAANHTLLAIDETRSAGLSEGDIGKMLINVIMRWESGFEKGRKNVARLRQAASVPFVLTSNLSLGQFGAKAGQTIDDALHGRLISIPMPVGGHGLFEDLHGEPDLVAFSRRLRELAAQHFGHPSRKFLEALAAENEKDPKGLKAWLEKRRQSYLTRAKAIISPGRHMHRIHEKMATAYAAVRFAIKHAILPWDKPTALDSLLACTRDHVALVAKEGLLNQTAIGSHHKLERTVLVEEPLTTLKNYLRDHHEEITDITVSSDVDSLPREPAQRPVLKSRHERHGIEYLFTESKLMAILGNKNSVQALKSHLHKSGHIATEGSGGALRYSVKRKIPGQTSRQQYIAIKAIAVDS